MKLPCESAVWYTLPNIRADLARELVKQDMSQKEVAEKLGITPSAISQYLHKKRGGKNMSSTPYKKKIKETAKKIREGVGEKQLEEIICQCCMMCRD
ncbi:transcriptional regulator [Candidatus Altiarchaeota archaeon]